MSRSLQVGDVVRAVSARRVDGDGATAVVIDGESRVVRVRRDVDGALFITRPDGTGFRAVISRDGSSVWVTVGDRTIRLEEAIAGATSDSSAHGGLEAPMPGRVLAIQVAIGDVVAVGDVLVIVEAMKMEHAIKAPTDGVVTAIRCSDGALVSPGTALIVLSADGGVGEVDA